MQDEPARLPATRRAQLAQYVSQVGQVTVPDLVERFAVSADTVRRDLDQLDADGLVVRTHGGAVSPSSMPRIDSGLNARIQVQPAAKERIGGIAAGLVENGHVIVINGGTTSLALARHLRDHRELTVATNNLRLPLELSPKTVRELYVFGGDVRLHAQATVGPVAFPSRTGGRDLDIRFDLALITVGGVSAEGGFSTSNLGEAGMMREMMQRAARVVVLADSSKFGRTLFAQVAPLGAADALVTDRPPAETLATQLRQHKVAIVTN